jgi:hypothetical protein
MKMIVICLIALKMEVVSTSETSVSNYETISRNIPEDSHLHTRGRKNLKSHLIGTDDHLLQI